jgi:hypothetical protein
VTLGTLFGLAILAPVMFLQLLVHLAYFYFYYGPIKRSLVTRFEAVWLVPSVFPAIVVHGSTVIVAVGFPRFNSSFGMAIMGTVVIWIVSILVASLHYRTFRLSEK